MTGREQNSVCERNSVCEQNELTVSKIPMTSAKKRSVRAGSKGQRWSGGATQRDPYRTS